MNLPKLFFIALFSVSPALCAPPAGWKVLHDKTGACQIAVPSDWKVPADTAWIGQAPADQGDVELVSQAGKTVKPLSDMSQKVLMVNKVFSNTASLVFYSNQPTKSDHPITPYRAAVPGKDGTCAALFGARAGVSEETVKKIAATLATAK